MQALLALAALAIGVGAAYGVNAIRHPATTATRPALTPSLAASPSPSPSPLPSASPVVEVSPTPSAAPSAAPTATAAKPAQAPAASSPAKFPPELIAGTTYSYSGSGTLTAFAADKRDLGGSACARIDESTQSVPAGYVVYFFVSITFPDGNILSAGYIKSASERHDFGSVQKGSSRTGLVNPPGSTLPGSHTYCVTHSATGWSMTDDGTVIFTTTAEGATDTTGAEVDFHNTASLDPTGPAAHPVSFNLVVVGWHDLTVGGKAPTQLIGVVSRF